MFINGQLSNQSFTGITAFNSGATGLAIEPLVGGGAGAIYHTLNPPTANNFVLDSNGNNLVLNAPVAGQVILFRVANVAVGQISALGFVGVGYVVAALPVAPLTGTRAYVTDALAPVALAVVAGGGAVTVPVFYNGVSWIVV